MSTAQVFYIILDYVENYYNVTPGTSVHAFLNKLDNLQSNGNMYFMHNDKTEDYILGVTCLS